MDFLKLCFICMITVSVHAQDYAKISSVFGESYAFEAQQKYDNAIKAVMKVYDEKSYEINLRLGWLYYKNGNFTESVTHYTKAITIMPYSIEPRWGIVLPLTALNKQDDLLTQYQKILVINPDNSIASYRIGMIYFEKKNYVSAEKYFDKVVNLFPFDFDGLIMSAWTKYHLNNHHEAKILFNKALIRKPEDKSALEGLKLLK